MKILFSLLLITAIASSSNQPTPSNQCPIGPYVYYAEVTNVYDADTITADIDLGFHTWRKDEKLRLSGIDAPEVRGKNKVAGIKARDWLREQIQGKRIIIKSIKNKKKFRGSFGRYLVELYSYHQGTCSNLNKMLVNQGHASFRTY